MNDFTEGNAAGGSDEEKRGRVIQVRLITVHNNDDPRALLAVDEALASLDQVKDTGKADGFGNVAPDAIRDHQLESKIRGEVRDRLDSERSALIEQREAGDESVDLATIEKRAELVVEKRSRLRQLFKDLQTIDRDADDKTPWWRFAFKVVIKVTEKVLVGSGADDESRPGG